MGVVAHRTRGQIAACATAAGVLLAGAGCGSSGSGGSTPGSGSAGSSKGSTPSACTLFTAQIADDVLGKPAKKTLEATPNAHETQCVYTGSKAFASILAGDCAFMQQFNAPSEGKQVSGIGDSASVGATGMLACKGDLALDITAGITGDYTGAAATKVETQEEQLEKNLANAIFSASG